MQKYAFLVRAYFMLSDPGNLYIPEEIPFAYITTRLATILKLLVPFWLQDYKVKYLVLFEHPVHSWNN